MALVRRSAASLAAIANNGSVAELIFEQMLYEHAGRAAPSERRSWDRSIPVLANDLVEAGLGDVEVLLEHRLPLSSRRVDAILAGRHPKTGAASYVIVELKQWSEADLFEDDPNLVLIDGYGRHPRLHPVEQVRGYCEYLRDFVPALQADNDNVAGVAYLHNATEMGVSPLRRLGESRDGRLFTGERRADFMDFLRTRLAPGVTGAPYADEFLSSRAAPSRQLLAVAADEIRDREQFVLLDQQRLAHDLVLHATEAARAGDTKTVIVVSGGPGSGKSVIALSLLGELARRGRTVLHATGSRSFTQTLRQVTGRGSPRTRNLFKYFNQFVDADRNGLEVLILDEAHRIRETSMSRYTPRQLRTDRRQVDELIAAARVPVFLLDEHQVVRPGELGSVGEIEEHATSLGLAVQKIDLNVHFRCGGSEAYMEWVTRLLGLTSGGPLQWAAIPLSPYRSPIVRTSWSTCCGPSSTRDTVRGWRPATAGHGVIPARTAPSSTTSSSATGQGRGTCAATGPSAVHRRPRCGRRIRQDSARSDASIRHRASNTTGTGSLLAATSSGAGTAGVQFAKPTGTRTFAAAPK